MSSSNENPYAKPHRGWRPPRPTYNNLLLLAATFLLFLPDFWPGFLTRFLAGLGEVLGRFLAGFREVSKGKTTITATTTRKNKKDIFLKLFLYIFSFLLPDFWPGFLTRFLAGFGEVFARFLEGFSKEKQR